MIRISSHFGKILLLALGVLLAVNTLIFSQYSTDTAPMAETRVPVSSDTNGAVADAVDAARAPSSHMPIPPDVTATNQGVKEYAVVKVIDGDTIAIDMNGVREVVRLIGVDTPESVDPRRTVECFGKEASAYLRSELSGRRVTIETDPTQDVRDKYGRMLAYVFRDDGALMNERIIAEGYGREYTYAVPYRRQASFRDAEHRARVSERGLWASHACTDTLTPPPTPPPSKPTTGVVSDSFDTSAYRCDTNTYNCADFRSQAEAQFVFARCGGTENDIHRLDRDGDGSVCESLK